MLEKYLQRIFEMMQRGDAREESYYSSLEQLLSDHAEEDGRKLHITPLPKKTEAGNPDFRVWDGRRQIVGYIEAKGPSVENLNVVEHSEQLKRYRGTFPNLILTNFFEFRLYRKGELLKTVSVGRPFVAYKLKTVPPAQNEKEFSDLLSHFFSFSIPKTTTAKQLAIELAHRTHFLRDQVIAEELKESKLGGLQMLEAYHQAFKEHLIHSLDERTFSDLLAQTISYGLFAARSRATNGFDRRLAYNYIPHTIGILRDVFRFISSEELPKQMEWIIDDIAEVLAAADVQKIIENFQREKRGRDPIVHFYETFLAEYDPKEREKRGVYYTPESVVGYIVRSIHKLLKEKFGKADGFADSAVTLLDPAAGTLTFPAEAIRQAVEEYRGKYGESVTQLIKDHILKDFYAFELMMAPYTVGHLKIGFTLAECGYELSPDERFKLYLTNTLEFGNEEEAGQLPGVGLERAIAKESEEAFKVKKDIPVMVVMGNPPYSGVSENKGKWISEKIEDYKRVDGQPLGERKHWLQDDYVKFFRFAQWKIEQTGQGILGFITNHAWLDNPTFRGMRSSLLSAFDEIYIVNLHGSTLKKEKVPPAAQAVLRIGEKDGNVFDIQPGVAIAILIKHPSRSGCGIRYADVWGTRERKYQWLEENDVGSTEWGELTPSSQSYFLVPREERDMKFYETFWKITDIFVKNSTGVLTGRDDFVTDFEHGPLEVRINALLNPQNSDEFIKSAYHLKDKPAYKWFVTETRMMLQEDSNWKKYFTKILYRPFDERWIYYHSELIFWPRTEIMQHMQHPNLAFITCRQHSGDFFQHILVANTLVESCYVSNKTKEIGYVFPLWIYHKENKQKGIFSGQEKLDLKGVQHTLRERDERTPNLNVRLLECLRAAFGEAPTPEDIFAYTYAVAYASTYRGKYEEFLKTDFPRIPFTGNRKLFYELAALGQKLIELHLLRAAELETPIVRFAGEGNHIVGKCSYIESQKRTLINETHYFEGITPEVWNYHIGGYQVLDKWLKSRKGRELSAEDIKHFCRIATALSMTIGIQEKIDELYPAVEKSLLESK